MSYHSRCAVISRHEDDALNSHLDFIETETEPLSCDYCQEELATGLDGICDKCREDIKNIYGERN